MKTALVQLLVLIQIFNFGVLHSQDILDGMISKTWSAVEFSGFRIGQDICQRFTFKFTENNWGELIISVNFLSDDDRYNLNYTGIATFTYEIQETGTAFENSFEMNISYDSLSFLFQEKPKYDPYYIPPDHLSYLEKIKQHISKRQEMYKVIFEGDANMVIEGFSLINDTDYVSFQSGFPSESCDSMLRNK